MNRLRSDRSAVGRLLATLRLLLPVEWTRPISALFISGLIVVPLVYAGNMTWSFDDPVGHLNGITAAVVNDDRGADVTGPDDTTRHLEVGAEFSRTLQDKEQSNLYHFVAATPEQAQRGLEDGTYGAVVHIPADLSASIGALGGDNPAATSTSMIRIATNDSVNYVGGNFTKSLGRALTDALRDKVTQEYLGEIYLGFTRVHDGLTEASDGATKLADGSRDLHSGSTRLRTGSAELSSGAHRLQDGAGTFVVGLDELHTGTVTLHHGTAQLADGSQHLSTGLGTLAGNSERLRGGAGTLADGSGKLQQGSARLADGAQAVAGGTQQLDEAAQRVDAAVKELGITPESAEKSATRLRSDIDAMEKIAHDAVDLVAALPKASDLQEKTAAVRDNVRGASTDTEAIRTATETISRDTPALTGAVSTGAERAKSLRDNARTHEKNLRASTRGIEDLAARCGSSGASEDFCAQLRREAASAATQREDAHRLTTDAQTLSDGLTTARTSADTVTEAARTASTHAASLHTEMAAILPGAEAAATAADTLAGDLDSARHHLTDPIHDDPDAAHRRITERADRARGVIAKIPELLRSAQGAAAKIHRLNSGAQEVAGGARTLNGGITRLHNGAQELSGGVQQYTAGVDTASAGAARLTAGAQQANDGAGRLADGAARASTGAKRLRAGSTQLADGADRLHDGAKRLDDGTAKLEDGAGTLSTRLSDASESVPTYTDGERKHLATAAADPVAMHFDRQNQLAGFGAGLMPLFLSIGLWVGGMATFLMMPPISGRAARRGVGALGLLAGGLLPALLLGLVQSAVAVLVLHTLVGIEVKHLAGLYAVAAFTSMVFVALNHGFGALFGPVGKFVALVLVALQISGAGGTYPVGTLPHFFQSIHHLLPMTHAIDAMRGLIGGGWVNPVEDFAWLSGWLLFAVLMGLAGAAVQRRRLIAHMHAADQEHGDRSASGDDAAPRTPGEMTEGEREARFDREDVMVWNAVVH